ncbi:hypothetical protein L7E55_02240 [Pelotomaculum isophthalicicum JI]|uniref:Uncharacterized protein n=1 Tax=Pelotomaculum isophthalicicum JI TaxID=947010 RepID=A0A9X4H4Y4_9FIRM|nr:hypothetical protein [Pelotomaculum isophthalicicum]MDF9407184.1 hypothetical protein [Pelotomaculum isophthalicicum JI]
MQQQTNPFIQQASHIQQQINPLIQNAMQYGQISLGEFVKVASISQNMFHACDDIIRSINSGNTQSALASAQNLRGMTGQLMQSTQFLSNSIAQRMDMALYMLSNAQQRIGELTNFIHSMRPQLGFTNVTPYHQTTSYTHMGMM